MKLAPHISLAMLALAAATASLSAEETNAPADWNLMAEAQTDGAGIFLDQIFTPTTANAEVPHIRLAPAPSPGQTASFSRQQIIELARRRGAELLTTNWSGANQIRVSRRTRQFADSDLIELLTTTLQRDVVKDRGDLEIHLTRSWTTVAVPDEPLEMRVSGLPANGLSPNMTVLCDLWIGREHVGGYPVSIQASLWRDVPVARSPVSRGTLLRNADLAMERTDVLQHREAYLNYSNDDGSLEMADNLQPGMMLQNRSVRVRPLIQRGHFVDAVYKDGSLSISLKVETLEDGLPGQMVRVRNPKTNRELYGKVENEQTVLISL
jgi:flagella basal body P-ring formation protein FlgA